MGAKQPNLPGDRTAQPWPWAWWPGAAWSERQMLAVVLAAHAVAWTLYGTFGLRGGVHEEDRKSVV